MNKEWDGNSWDEYTQWLNQDKKTVNKINKLVKDIEINGVSKGIGKPEFLKYEKMWSRHIDDFNRLTYDVIDGRLVIYSCKGHYK